ncbi:DUF2569 family protein [Thiovibrio frasassiensis]|uniref:DUF2569 domain-containing protein n=1 Tax=Thiovibrio frasassiensis TaxID=2984131 RepID=A0A9X4MEJ0_9BACT|nr:DUF2569 family protein [Thiovibrio frasassiensis]MDG4474828.1 DUF2569 domain-containing protein [Thiovibrio frasassiensis]
MDSTLLLSFLPLPIFIVIAWAISRAIKKAANKHPPATPDQSAISGIGGWLLLLILGLMFLGPLMGAGRINLDFMSVESQYPNLKTVAAWGTFKSSTWLTFLLVSCLSFYAGIGLVKSRNILVVKRAKIIIWVIGPAASILLGILIPLLVFGKSDPDPKFVGSMIASIVGAAIWTAYLSKSKRVLSTYGIKPPST